MGQGLGFGLIFCDFCPHDLGQSISLFWQKVGAKESIFNLNFQANFDYRYEALKVMMTRVDYVKLIII